MAQQPGAAGPTAPGRVSSAPGETGRGPVELSDLAALEALGFGDLTMAHELIARHVDNPLAAMAVTPLVYVAVMASAGLLALVATALPGRMAIRVRPIMAATARE